MDDPRWRIDGHLGWLESCDFSARIDLARPELGLGDLTVGAAGLSGSLLGVIVESGVAGRTPDQRNNDAPLEAYVRGNELVATYAPTVDVPVGFQVEWEASLRDDRLLVLETMVSVQTPLLESYPTVLIRSSLKAKSVKYIDADAQESPIIPSDPSQATFETAGVALLEINDGIAYAEMVHPTDFLGCEFGGDLQTQWRMCDHFMEKGVIRRLRARGIFFPSAPTATELLAELNLLATEQPPLTA